jgi:hypothetical protein
MRGNTSILIKWSAFALFMAMAVVGDIAAAQDPGQEQSDKSAAAARDSGKKPENSDSVPVSPLSAGSLNTYFYQIGTAGLLAGNREGLHLGGLYIPTASATGVVDKFEGTKTSPGVEYDAAVLQTTVIYDHTLGQNRRFAIQYQPSIAFANGQVVRDFSNQNTSIDLLLYTRPRWSVRFSDGFQYRYTQRAVGYPYLDVNPVTSGTVQNTFLDGPRRWLSDSAYVSVAYALSPRSSIGVSPGYVFSESGTGSNFAKGVSYGGNVNWNYRTSERQTIGFVYSGQLIRETETSVATFDTIYQTFAGTWGRQLAASLFVQGAGGLTTSTSSIASSTRQWYFYGNLGAVKQIGRSAIALTYSRSDTLFYGLISSQYADRVDLTYQARMSQRLSWSIGGGYLRQVQSGGVAGWYTTSNVQFLLSPRAGLSATFDYSHKNQRLGNVVTNLFAGNRDVYTFGIRWAPAQAPH